MFLTDLTKISRLIVKNGADAYAINQDIIQIFEIVKKLAYENESISIGSDTTADLLKYIKAIQQRATEIWENATAEAGMILDAMNDEIDKNPKEEPHEISSTGHYLYRCLDRKRATRITPFKHQMTDAEFEKYVDYIGEKYKLLVYMEIRKELLPECLSETCPSDVIATISYIPMLEESSTNSDSGNTRFIINRCEFVGLACDCDVIHTPRTYLFYNGDYHIPLKCSIFVPLDDADEFEKDTGLDLGDSIFVRSKNIEGIRGMADEYAKLPGEIILNGDMNGDVLSRILSSNVSNVIKKDTPHLKKMRGKEFREYVDKIEKKYNFLIYIFPDADFGDQSGSIPHQTYIPNWEIIEDGRITPTYYMFSSAPNYAAVIHCVGTYWFRACAESCPLRCRIFVPMNDSVEFEEETGTKLDDGYTFGDNKNNGVAIYKTVAEDIILTPESKEDDVILSILLRNVIIDDSVSGENFE